MTEEHYRPDQFQQPFTILRRTPVADGAGGFAVTEAQVGPTHFALVRPLRGDEVALNAGLAAVVGIRLVTWAAIGILSTDVLLCNGIRYNVRALLPPGLSKYQELDAESGVVS